MLSTLSNLFALLAAYVRHRTETDLDRRIEMSRRELRKMASEINRLRASGSPDASQRADELRGECISEAKHLKYLYSRRSADSAGREGAD